MAYRRSSQPRGVYRRRRPTLPQRHWVGTAVAAGGGGIDVPILNVSAADEGTGPGHVLTVAAPGIAANNRAFVAGIVAGGRTLTGVTDSQGNTWAVDETLANSTNHGGGGASSKLTTALSAGDTVTLTFSGTGVFFGALLDLGDGLTATQPDISVSQAFTVAQTGVDSSTGATSDTADELQIGLAMHAGSSALTPETLSPVWNHIVSGNPTTFVRTLRVYYRIVAATEAQRFAGTLGAAQVNTGFLITYRGSAAGGSTVSRTVADSLTLGDSVVRSGGFARTASDSLQLADSASRVLTLLRTVGSSGSPGGQVVQSKAAHVTTAATSTSITLDAAPTNGNTLVLIWTMREANDETFTPDNGTWTSITKVQSSGIGTWPHEMFYQSNISGLSATTTVPHPATLGGSREIILVELQGPLDFDTFISTNNSSTTSGSITPASSTVAAMVSSTYNRTDSGPGLLSPAGSMTELHEVSRVGVNHEREAPPSGSYTVGSTGANANSSFIGATFKAGSGGGGDSITFGNTVAAQKITVRSVADTLGLTDSVARSVALIRSVSDSLSLGNSVVRVLTAVRTTADSLGLTDSVARVLTAVRTVADNLTLGSTVDAIKVTARSLSDSLTLGNTVSRTGTFLRSTSDSLGLSDSVSRTLTLIRTAADGLTLGNVVSGIKLIVRTVSDSLSLGNSVARVVSLLRTATDGLTLGNSVSRTGTFIRTAADGLGLSDAVTRGLTYVRTVGDSLTFGNTVSSTKIIVRSVADSLSFVDSVVRSIGGGAVVIGGVPPRIAGALRAGMTSLASRLHPDGGRGDHPHPTGRGDHPKPGG